MENWQVTLLVLGTILILAHNATYFCYLFVIPKPLYKRSILYFTLLLLIIK